MATSFSFWHLIFSPLFSFHPPSRQLRTRECVDTDFFLYCATKSPIIESSSNLRFHPFDIAYPHLTQQFVSAKLDPNVNHWDVIYDFSANDATIPQPHSIIIHTIPPLITLRCFNDGKEIDGDFKDTPIKIAYPSQSEMRVEKGAPTAAPIATESSTSTSADNTASPSVASVESSSTKMESFGSSSIGSSTSSVPAFEAGVAPTLPHADIQSKLDETKSETTTTEPTDKGEATNTPNESSSSSTNTGAVSAAASESVSSDVSAPVVVKEASFSITTSAEDATRALFELAGVTYVPPPTQPVAPVTAAASSPMESSPEPVVDQEKAFENWFTHTPGMVSQTAGSAEPLPAVAAAEAERLKAIEVRRAEAEAKAQEAKAAASAQMKEFYAQREEEQR